jgi:hypothetical protein
MQLQLEFQIYHLLTGLLGGLVRGLVGILKQTNNPDEFKSDSPRSKLTGHHHPVGKSFNWSLCRRT